MDYPPLAWIEGARTPPNIDMEMSLRPLLEIAAEDERFHALTKAVREAEPATVHMSAAIRPFLLAALVSSEEGLGDRPALIVAPDDIAARDLARDLQAYLAPRRVRLGRAVPWTASTGQLIPASSTRTSLPRLTWLAFG